MPACRPTAHLFPSLLACKHSRLRLRGAEHVKGAYAANIHVVPHVDGVGVAQLYKAADAFALATHAEGWGRPVMEAMAMVGACHAHFTYA